MVVYDEHNHQRGHAKEDDRHDGTNGRQGRVERMSLHTPGRHSIRPGRNCRAAKVTRRT